MITSADITVEELIERLDKGETPVIIDVREDWEYQESNIAGAQNIPLGTLPQKVADLEDLKDREVIVQCRSGARSANAKAFLQQQGFNNVRNLLGGILAYNKAQG
ncbi:rhodanese-related sulfurtransferase [Pontibacter ummariensis]|uniref:Rhodanese-related sulfurtransferase n=1 Tax=Pontibacter ummariensis TaxID=1610492 RepID=A0A239EQW4_9BACT|nr:rhodanese-like domain-containing protein [Pontibacter ummariensis]PRY12802.1 rhodanese-related sulfurtransferase [Pontibacter ummariensis]SNS46801.1 Rhodanese-related sulfurtransferase [Pontibacter ummariensis]